MNKLLRTLAIILSLINSHICLGQDSVAVVAKYKDTYYAMTSILDDTYIGGLKSKIVSVVNNKVINEIGKGDISWIMNKNGYIKNRTKYVCIKDQNISLENSSNTDSKFKRYQDGNEIFWYHEDNNDKTKTTSFSYRPLYDIFKNYATSLKNDKDYAFSNLMTFSDGYTRTISINGEGYKWGTICMPNTVNAGDFAGATFYSIVGKEIADGTVTALVLKEEEKFEAGMPYIFKATANIVAAYSGESVSDPKNKNGLYGVLSGTVTINGNEGYYGVANNKVNPLGAGATIPANRAYIRMNEVPEYTENTAEAKVIRFDMNEATNIISTTMDDEEVYFNLKGQRVIEPKNGIYIKNGKKVLIK